MTASPIPRSRRFSLHDIEELFCPVKTLLSIQSFWAEVLLTLKCILGGERRSAEVGITSLLPARRLLLNKCLCHRCLRRSRTDFRSLFGQFPWPSLCRLATSTSTDNFAPPPPYRLYSENLRFAFQRCIVFSLNIYSVIFRQLYLFLNRLLHSVLLENVLSNSPPLLQLWWGKNSPLFEIFNA